MTESEEGRSSCVPISGTLYRAIVYNAARDGNMRRLRIFLEHQSDSFLDGCLNIRDGSTDKVALVVAAREGHLAIVEYLILMGADPSLCGTVSFDGETIHNAPPLWAAAAAGHLDIVKYLIEIEKVQINQTTQTNSSPLRGACYDGHLEIVKYLVEEGADLELANRHGHTPLMIASFRKKDEVVQYLLEKGACPKKSSFKGNTALHDAAEADCYPVCELLLEAGAELVDDDGGLCPLMGAAMMANLKVFPLLSRHCKSPLRRRDAYRILGCTLIDKKLDIEGGVNVWKSALNVHLTNDEEKMENSRNALPLHPVFNGYSEVLSIEELDRLKDDPEQVKMQSLIVRQRILGHNHTDVHYFLRLRGAVYCDQGDVSRCFDLWLYALELQQIHLGPLHISTLATMQAFYETMALTLDELVNESARRPIPQDILPFSITQVERVYHCLCHELDRLEEWGDRDLHEDCAAEGHDHDIEEEKRRVALIALQILVLGDRLNIKLKNNQRQLNIVELIRVCLNVKIPLLHLACWEAHRHEVLAPRADDTKFPSTYCVEQFLSYGMKVDAVDENNQTPLHIILTNKLIRPSIIQRLIDGGASLYTRDNNGVTCFDLLRKLDGKKDKTTVNDINIGGSINLIGMTSLAVRRFNIPYDTVPYDLHKFISKH